ncbi:MAG TPA: tyrosine-type recombinase/integrase [Melioribacteraceae bacterium]|nr:tyrosine-type recombinase/integrase [Melioribacteraceae bacterium]
MGTLYKGRNSPYWHYKFVLDGVRKDISTKCRNRRDAEHFVKLIEAKQNEKVIFNIKVSPPLSIGLKHYLSVRSLKKSSESSYKNAVEHFITAAGEKRIDEYTIFDYEALIRYLEKNDFAEASKGIITRNVFAVFNYFVKNEYIRKNPITAIRIKEKPKPIDEMDLIEIRKYFAENDPLFYRIIEFALLTGFRRSTICAPMSIDMPRRLIQARNVKADRDFVIPIYKALEEFLLGCGYKEYFVGRFTKLNESTISHKFGYGITKLTEEKRISKHYKFHHLRHTAATEFGKAGLDIKSIKDILDHTDIRTSENYIKTNFEYLRSKLDGKN